ncbi:MAG: hypothetical protein DI626_01235 [Micavibrio aeruginosavorus]|uniref:Uncharacterized protein n=1 Tax=Micavibrio aeruginosavorus TaxID=349221 RepID=A0A2W5C3I0_9BACT|nr:MAG: hypothetical protein DI626_01235 [Micavibrio aeruginosavorus]
MMSEDMKKQYDFRFRHFIREIIVVSRMKPKEKFIYRIMDGVPFKDLETALMMAKMDYGQKMDETVNDNHKA